MATTAPVSVKISPLVIVDNPSHILERPLAEVEAHNHPGPNADITRELRCRPKPENLVQMTHFA